MPKQFKVLIQRGGRGSGPVSLESAGCAGGAEPKRPLPGPAAIAPDLGRRPAAVCGPFGGSQLARQSLQLRSTAVGAPRPSAGPSGGQSTRQAIPANFV